MAGFFETWSSGGVAVERPAQEGQVVDEGVGVVAGVAVLLHGRGAVALAELLAVRAQDHGDVRERGGRGAQGLVHHDLARGVGQVVVAADDVGDAHHGVVHHGREVVGGGAVGAEDDEVVQRVRLERDVAVDGVVHHNVAAVQRHLDADGVRLAGVHAALRLGRVDVAARALVALERVVALLGGLLVCRELLRRAEAVVRPAVGDEALRRLAIDVQALRLPVGAKVAAYLGTLVPVKAQPLHGAQDDLRVLLRGAGGVRVVDPQDERAVVGAGECPVVDGGAGAAHVQLAGGRGRKAHAYGTCFGGTHDCVTFRVGCSVQSEPV